MAETSSLLNCRRGNSTASSNLVLSATVKRKSLICKGFRSFFQGGPPKGSPSGLPKFLVNFNGDDYSVAISLSFSPSESSTFLFDCYQPALLVLGIDC